MAAGILSGPGTEYGPCVEACEHLDCRETRSMAAADCWHCGNPIGYGVRFYDSRRDDRGLMHALCEENSINEERELGYF